MYRYARRSGVNNFWSTGFGADDSEAPAGETAEEKAARLARLSDEGQDWFKTIFSAFSNKDDKNGNGDSSGTGNGTGGGGVTNITLPGTGINASALLIPGALVLGIFLMTRKKK